MNRLDANQTIREIVLLSGTLAKSGTIANCIVRATKVTIPGLQDSEYVQADVALAPPHLPNGQYEFISSAAECPLAIMLDVGRSQDPASTPQRRSRL
jgi:hypothetical protein